MSDAINPSPQVEKFADDCALHSWLEEQAQPYQLSYLLAHAEDGVIWGRFDNGTLTTAEKIFHKPEFEVDFPTLRLLTLQQCRVFGQNGERLLWRTGETWRSRFLGNPQVDKIPESQILWGTHGKKRDNFTLLWHGSQGLKHAVPFTNIALDERNKLINPVRLLVHHYITYDDSGVARIHLSRLVDLTSGKEPINAPKTPQRSTGRA